MTYRITAWHVQIMHCFDHASTLPVDPHLMHNRCKQVHFTWSMRVRCIALRIDHVIKGKEFHRWTRTVNWISNNIRVETEESSLTCTPQNFNINKAHAQNNGWITLLCRLNEIFRNTLAAVANNVAETREITTSIHTAMDSFMNKICHVPHRSIYTYILYKLVMNEKHHTISAVTSS